MDFLVVPTVGFRLLLGLIIFRHQRRRPISCSVTAHPTAAWIARRITDVFPKVKRLTISSATATLRTHLSLGKDSPGPSANPTVGQLAADSADFIINTAGYSFQ